MVQGLTQAESKAFMLQRFLQRLMGVRVACVAGEIEIEIYEIPTIALRARIQLPLSFSFVRRPRRLAGTCRSLGQSPIAGGEFQPLQKPIQQ